jgi:hypothetical protein
MTTLSNTSNSTPAQSRRSYPFIRNVLRGNVIFSLLAGLDFIFMAPMLAAFFGVPGYAWALRLLGVSLLPFGAFVFWVSNQEPFKRFLIWEVFWADVLWVVGTVIILWANVFGFSRAGNWTFLAIGDIVAVFAVLEFIGLRRMRS